jgi:hypothetical protein
MERMKYQVCRSRGGRKTFIYCGLPHIQRIKLDFVAAVVHKSHKAIQPLANGLKPLKHQLETGREVPFNWASKMLY